MGVRRAPRGGRTVTLDDREAIGRLIIIAHVQAERLAALEADVAKLKAARSAAAGERACAVCGEALVRRPGERSDAFKARKTCGGECRGALNAAQPIAERVARFVNWLGGLPLTVADVAEVLGVSESRCREVLRALADEGRVRRWRDPENAQQWLYAALEDMEAA